MGKLSSNYPNSNAVEAALDRANSAAHDISILSEDVTALQTAVAGKASQSDLTALSNTVADKADADDLTALAATVSGKADAADLTALEEEVDTKADTSALTTAAANLQAQIDNLITPVTEDAEVQNARVGADGTSYQTLKARLDGENSELKEGLTEITRCRIVEWVDGYYIKTNVEVVDINSPVPSVSKRYSVISCSDGDKFLINGNGENAPRLWCFIDDSGNVVSVSNYSAVANNLVLIAPENATKLILNDARKTDASYVGLPTWYAIEASEEIIGTISDEVSKLANGKMYYQADEFKINATTNNDGDSHYIYHVVPIDLNGFIGTLYVKIDNLTGNVSPQPLQIETKDSQGNTIETYNYFKSDLSNISLDITSNIRSIRLIYYPSVNYGLTDTFAIYSNVRVFSSPNGEYTINTKLLPDVIPVKNPIHYTGREFCAFDKVLCIGDSLTAGVFNSNETGTEVYHTITKYSYPTQMKKLFGVETMNWGIGGVTASQWYANKQNEDWSGYDCALIILGANDAIQSSTDTKSALQNIVNKAKNSNNGIKIFLGTLLPAYYWNYANYNNVNNAIEEIANENSDCYLIDLTRYSECKRDTVYAQGHLTAVGYMKEAEELVSYCSYIMANSGDEFRYIQFINTDWSWSDNP